PHERRPEKGRVVGAVVRAIAGERQRADHTATGGRARPPGPTDAMTLGIRARWASVRRVFAGGDELPAILVPDGFALMTFAAGAILLWSGATPARAGRMGWVNDFLPLPVVEASTYFASIAGVGLIILARGLQLRLDAAYHLTMSLLVVGI